MLWRRIAAFAIMVSLLSACSQHRLPATTDISPMLPSDTKIESEKLSWWKIRFRIAFPKGVERDQAVALLLADTVVGPVLKEHSDQLLWWRFHRRAARDHAGHQFSFMFYSNPNVATQVVFDIEQNMILQSSLQSGLVEQVIYPDTSKPDRPQIEAYSDPAWPLSVQRSWPSYIMGVSAMWLGLIDELKTGGLSDETDVKLLLEQYRAINNQIIDLWYLEGQHALLHHLSAMFGYEPMLIRKGIQF